MSFLSEARIVYPDLSGKNLFILCIGLTRSFPTRDFVEAVVPPSDDSFDTFYLEEIPSGRFHHVSLSAFHSELKQHFHQ